MTESVIRCLPLRRRRTIAAMAALIAALSPLPSGAQSYFKASALAGACGGSDTGGFEINDPGSHASASSSGTIYDNGNPIAECAASARANGDTATLGTYAFARTTNYSPAAGETSVSFQDMLTFYASASAAAGPIPVTLRMLVAGRFNGYGLMTSTTSLFVGEPDFSNPGTITLNRPVGRVGFSWQGPSGPFGSALASYSTSGLSGALDLSLDPDQVHVTMLLSFTALPDHHYVIGASQDTSAYPAYFQSALADFSHTATLGLDLPPGYGFTSQSGVFLSAVPEPTSAALVLAGLLALVRLAKSRQQSAAVGRQG